MAAGRFLHLRHRTPPAVLAALGHTPAPESTSRLLRGMCSPREDVPRPSEAKVTGAAGEKAYDFRSSPGKSTQSRSLTTPDALGHVGHKATDSALMGL